ncbi:MAG: HEPN domain-containing protein [Syntrophorhabdales bacterium]|jgi:HEPN domain-containing protein
MKEKVRYWTDTAQYDLDTARAMLEARRFLYVGFMCHQTIEKVLKGFYVYTRKSNPPYTHNLNYLATEAGVYALMSEDQRSTLDMLEPLNVEARYPRHREELLKTLDSAKCEEIIGRTEEPFRWIEKQLSNG